MVMALATPIQPAVYARISQDRTGLSIGVDDQIQQCRQHAERLGWPGPRVYSDNDISAAKRGARRPGFEQLLVDIADGQVDALICRHLDRLLRRVVDLERILDATEASKLVVPIEFVMAGQIDLKTASGRLLARILASVAANEVEVKSERVGQARRREALAGRSHGPLGYGYDKDQLIVPAEAEIVREVANRVLAGESFYGIATDLNSRGVPTPGAGQWDARRLARTIKRGERPDVIALADAARKSAKCQPGEFARLLRRSGAAESTNATWVKGQSWVDHLLANDHGMDDAMIAKALAEAQVPADPSYWRAANIRYMIRRGSLCGWREFSPGGRGGRGEMVAQGGWTPILTKDTIDRIREITDRPANRKRGRDPKYLLATILKCGICGSSLGGSKTGDSYRYSCSKQPGRPVQCKGLTIAGPQVDHLVSMAVIDALADAKVRAGTGRGAGITPPMRKAEAEIGEVTALRKRYAVQAGEGRLHPDAFDALMETLETRQKAAERTLGSWAPNLKAVLSDVPKDRRSIEGWWRGASLRRKREVIQALVERIDIERRGKGIRRFDPTRIGEPVWRF